MSEIDYENGRHYCSKLCGQRVSTTIKDGSVNLVNLEELWNIDSTKSTERNTHGNYWEKCPFCGSWSPDGCLDCGATFYLSWDKEITDGTENI